MFLWLRKGAKFRDHQAKTKRFRQQCEVRKICHVCPGTILRCVTYQVNHAMLFRSNFNDNSSAALGGKRLLIIYVTLKRILETMFLPEAEKRIAKLVFIA